MVGNPLNRKRDILYVKRVKSENRNNFLRKLSPILEHLRAWMNFRITVAQWLLCVLLHALGSEGSRAWVSPWEICTFVPSFLHISVQCRLPDQTRCECPPWTTHLPKAPLRALLYLPFSHAFNLANNPTAGLLCASQENVSQRKNGAFVFPGHCYAPSTWKIIQCRGRLNPFPQIVSDCLELPSSCCNRL